MKLSVSFIRKEFVPEDLSVTGFDDNIYARLSRPMLTTMRRSRKKREKKQLGF